MSDAENSYPVLYNFLHDVQNFPALGKEETPMAFSFQVVQQFDHKDHFPRFPYEYVVLDVVDVEMSSVFLDHLVQSIEVNAAKTREHHFKIYINS